MNQSVKLSKAISYIVLICAAIVFLAIWPLGIIHQTHVSKSNELIAMESDPVSVEKNVTQMFVAEGGELSAVDLYVCNDMRGETITFRLYDASYTEIFNTFHVVKDNQKFPGFVHIPVGFDLEKDQEYYFTLEGLSADMTVAYEERETSTSIVNGFMSYGGIEIQRFNVIIRYEYSNPFTVWQVLLSALVIAAVSAGILRLVRILFAKKLTDREVKVQNVLRVTLNPIVVIGAGILCLMIFPGRKFGTGMLNYAFYGGSILLLAMLLLFLINYKRTGCKPLVDIDTWKKRMPEYLQSACIAAAIWYCYEYMNGLYEIHHSFATRRMLVWFLLGIICMYTKKELLRIGNLVYLVIAGILAYWYARPYFGVEEDGDLYKLNAYIMVIGGLVILLMFRSIIRRIQKKDSADTGISLPYVLFFAVVMGCMLAFRNGRDWLIVMAVIFTLFYLRVWMWKKNSRISYIVTNGLIINYIVMVVYSLLHRPYHRYYYYRYGLGYHTVTMTGVYLALVTSAIVVKLLLKYQEEKKLLCVWPELILLGTANAYLIMTLSRTGYLAAIVMEVFIVTLFTFRDKNHQWKEMTKQFGIIIAITCLAFPIVFTMTRIIPAISNDPILSEVEMTGVEIKKGTPSDSELYMDIKRFFEVAGIKMTGDYQEARMFLNPGDVFVINDDILLASTEDKIEDVGTLDSMTNGRIEIFKAYIANWNMTGHEDMGVLWSDGTMTVHAHNVFLQIIHDHGLPTGILFILFGVASFVIALMRFIQKRDMACALTMTVIVSFAVSGLAEWNFHLCNPFGIALFMAVTPLFFKSKDIEKDEQ